MANTKYSRLNPQKYRDRDTLTYSGYWCGEMISFKREFRGHVFTDEECEALLAGQLVEVHNIQGKRGRYAVQGKLSRVDRGFMSLVKFDVLDTIPNNPNHKFGMPLYDLHPKAVIQTSEDVDLNDNDLDGIYFGDMADVMRDAKAYQEQQLMAAEAALAALHDENEDYLNIADENPYGDFEEHELFGVSDEISDSVPDNEVSADVVMDFSDEDYDDFDDEDIMFDDIVVENN